MGLNDEILRIIFRENNNDDSKEDKIKMKKDFIKYIKDKEFKSEDFIKSYEAIKKKLETYNTACK